MNAVIAQCGGPTAVINTSLVAVIEQWRQLPGAGRIFGARFGMQGLVTGDWVDLTQVPPDMLADLAAQPAAALGSSRYRPSDLEMLEIVEQLRALAVNALFLIGGNGTMVAAERIDALAHSADESLQVVGIPKTIDNDLAGTEFAPGYGSAARYIAYTTQDIGLDLRAMRGFDQIAVIEVMGRHAGWLAAAAALARQRPDDPPHLILVPETPVEIDAVLQRIDAIFRREQICVVVAAEGVHDGSGRYWAELLGSAGQDPSGQRVFSMSAGAVAFLAQQVQEHLGLRCRQIKLNTAQRSNRLAASPVDRLLAALAGQAAVEAAQKGQSGVMVGLRAGAEGWRTEYTPLGDVVGRERLLPADFVDAAAYDVTQACTDYIRAVTGPLPPAPILWTEG